MKDPPKKSRPQIHRPNFFTAHCACFYLHAIYVCIYQDESNGELTWTPSKFIDRLGQEIDNEESVYYWCHKNQIPVFCPAITDGSVGDMLYFQTYKRSGFKLDIVRDVRALNDIAVKAQASGMVSI